MRLDERVGPQHLPEVMPESTHPVVELMHRRMMEDSRRGERDDGRHLALAVEGGGHRGAVSAGMCVVLEAAGLVNTIDTIYGTSSGALNGSFTAAGQAAIGSTNYADIATKDFYNPLRMLTKGQAVNFDILFDEVIRNRKPYDKQGLDDGPDFKALAVNPREKSVEILEDFPDVDDLMQAVRVSCALPLIAGPQPEYRGRPMIDGGLMEPIPYGPALDDGATDVLVLRSRPASFRKEAKSPELIRKILRRAPINLVSLLTESIPAYNVRAADLQARNEEKGNVYQIVPPECGISVKRIERSAENIRAGLRAGAMATAATFGLPNIDLYWQPVPYVAASDESLNIA